MTFPMPAFSPVVAAGATVSLANTDSASSTSNASTYQFTNVDFGAADSGRDVIVPFTATGGDTPTSVTAASSSIGGVTSTKVAEIQAGGIGVVISILGAAVPTGTSGTVEIVVDNAGQRAAMAAYRMVDASSLTAHDTANDTTLSTATLTLSGFDVPANGAALAVGIGQGNSASSQMWSNLTEDTDFSFEVQNTFSTASDEFASAQTGLAVATTFNSAPDTFWGLLGASWGP